MTYKPFIYRDMWEYSKPIIMDGPRSLASEMREPDFSWGDAEEQPVGCYDRYGWVRYENGCGGGNPVALFELEDVCVIKRSRGIDRYHIELEPNVLARDAYHDGEFISKHLGDTFSSGPGVANERLLYERSGEEAHITEPCVLLNHLWHQNYAHMLLETTTRFWAFDGVPELLAMPVYWDVGLPYQADWNFLQLDVGDKLRTHEPNIIRFDKLFVPGFICQIGSSCSSVSWLRRRFGTDGLPRGNKRLYITRRRARERRVNGENELLEFLKGFDFETYCPEAFTVSHQMETFSQASCVVAPHGAGCANMLFAPPSASLIEFLPTSYQHHMYQHICQWGGQRYGRIICPDSGPEKEMNVSKDALRCALEALL